MGELLGSGPRGAGMGGQRPGRRRCDERGQCRPGARGRWGQRGASRAHQYAVDAGTAPGTPDAWTRTGSGRTVRTAVVASTTVEDADGRRGEEHLTGSRTRDGAETVQNGAEEDDDRRGEARGEGGEHGHVGGRAVAQDAHARLLP